MKMKKITVLSVIIASLVSGSVVAETAQMENNTYVGLDTFNWTYRESGIPNYSATGVRGRLGVDITENIGIEGMIATGGSDTQAISGTNVKIDLNSMHGVYGKFMLPLGNSGDIYFRAGYAYVDGSAASSSVSIRASIDDFSWGGGVEFAMSDNLLLDIDYMVYLDEPTYDFTAIGAGIKYTF